MNRETKISLLMKSLSDFYNEQKYIDEIKQIVNQESEISLRILDWFITNYSKKIRTMVQIDDSGKKIDVYLYKEDNYSKDFVPINYNLNSKLEWLAGICDSDGCVTKNTGIQISSIDFNFLTNVKYLLQTLGCDPKISLMHLATDRLLPDTNRNL